MMTAAGLAMRARALRNVPKRAAAVHTEARLQKLGITLPAPGTPKANYNIVCWESPTLLYVSGHLPIRTDGYAVPARGAAALSRSALPTQRSLGASCRASATPASPCAAR